MVISDSKSFIFVHVQKTAGSSIRRLLQPYAVEGPRTRLNRLASRLGLVRDYRNFYFGHHDRLRAAQAVMPAERFEEMFKFGFVRNPWDRLVSWYAFLRQRPHHRRHKRVMALGSFDAYVEYEIRRDKISQFRMLRNEAGEIGVDFVGKFENLEADFNEVRRRLGVEGELPVHNVTKHAPYQDCYTPQLAGRVREHWGDEIEAFGYEFEPSS